jgi:predicted  nucleic acid-binding Zn-ribbon protein
LDNKNPDVQLCILLYDERVKTYHRMQEIHFILDDKPELSLEMIELDNRNRQANAELQAFSKHKVFAYKHPLVVRRKKYDDLLSELYELKRTDPRKLINEIANVIQNIRRIQSNIKRKKYKTDEEKEKWEENLSSAEIRKKVLEEVISK